MIPQLKNECTKAIPLLMRSSDRVVSGFHQLEVTIGANGYVFFAATDVYFATIANGLVREGGIVFSTYMANGPFLYDLVGYGHHQCGGLEWVAKVAPVSYTHLTLPTKA